MSKTLSCQAVLIPLMIAGSAISAPCSAQAETLYPCKVNAASKDHGGGFLEKSFILLQTRNNRIDLYFSNSAVTRLDLMIDRTGTFTGFVNDQYQFKLEGDVKTGGRFESATASGTISCSRPIKSDAVFLFKPWGRWYTPDFDSILRTVRLDRYSYTCFIGNARAAAQQISNRSNGEWKWEELQINDRERDSTQHSIQATRLEQECLEQPAIDADCLRWSEPKPVLYEMKHCDWGREERP